MGSTGHGIYNKSYKGVYIKDKYEFSKFVFVKAQNITDHRRG